MNGLVVDRLRIQGHEAHFTAPAGSTVALLGAPGSGTSTVLEAIAGLRRPDSGQVLLDGTPVGPRQIGLMQRPAHLFPELTAAENLAVPLLARGVRVDRASIEATLSSLGLAPATHHNLVEHLSGGQQQRVALARALVTTSPLLCLDEPVTELDETSIDTVWTALRGTSAAGSVVVIATADRELAARCDQTVEA